MATRRLKRPGLIKLPAAILRGINGRGVPANETRTPFEERQRAWCYPEAARWVLLHGSRALLLSPRGIDRKEALRYVTIVRAAVRAAVMAGEHAMFVLLPDGWGMIGGRRLELIVGGKATKPAAG